MLGEGSLASSFNEIISIANLQLPVCIIVFSDGRMHSVVNSKLIEEQIKSKFLPANFKTLEKIKIPNLPTASVNSLRQFNSAFSKWDMRSPLMLFLKFDPSTYAKGVELIR
jgi:thiamine pyrophosphate-dependent acetolactate synthase large subunit-like protein